MKETVIDTPDKARLILIKPLVFGNEDQISAARFLEAIVSAVEQLENCRILGGHKASGKCFACEGKEFHKCECGHEHECEECDGTGRDNDESIFDCPCVEIYSHEVIEYALNYFDNKQKIRPNDVRFWKAS